MNNTILDEKELQSLENTMRAVGQFPVPKVYELLASHRALAAELELANSYRETWCKRDNAVVAERDAAVSELARLRDETRWRVPTPEALAEIDPNVLHEVSLRNGDERVTEVGFYGVGSGQWRGFNGFSFTPWTVEAFRPLPAPYGPNAEATTDSTIRQSPNDEGTTEATEAVPAKLEWVPTHRGKDGILCRMISCIDERVTYSTVSSCGPLYWGCEFEPLTPAEIEQWQQAQAEGESCQN